MKGIVLIIGSYVRDGVGVLYDLSIAYVTCIIFHSSSKLEVDYEFGVIYCITLLYLISDQPLTNEMCNVISIFVLSDYLVAKINLLIYHSFIALVTCVVPCF